MKDPNTSQKRTCAPWLRRILALCALVAATATTYAQVSVTATGGDTGPTNYATVSAAFAAVNAGTHQGGITLTVTANTTEPAPATALVQSGTGASSYTSLLLTCSGNVTVNSAATPTTNRGIIELLGADNVTIDGDDPLTPGERNLTIQMATTTTTGTQCIRLASNSTSGADGANNVAVKNCNIIGGRSSATSTTSSWGIIMSNGTNGTGGAYSSLNTLIENNAITRCYTGIGAVGASATYLNTGLVIRNNVLGSAGTDNIGLSGIHVSYTATAAGAGSAKIEGNDVRAGDNGTTGYGSFVTGILVDAVNAGLLIERNNVHDVRQPSTGGWGPAGIRFSSATNNADITVRNNFIRDMVGARYSATLTAAFVPYSIHITSAVTNLRIDNNTIANRVEATTGSTPAGTYANHLVYATAGTIASFRNNILVNTLGSTNSMAFYCGTNTIISGGAVDNNSYHVPSGQVGYYGGAARANLSAWQTATGKDANAVSVDPPFMSSTDLHINTSAPEAAALNGTGAVTGIVQDFDGDYRPTPPSIGADELSPLPPCDGSFTAGSITAPTAYCDGSPGLLMTLSGATGGAGISVQWRSATNSGGPYSVDLGTGLTQSTGVILAPRYYQVEVSCAGHGSLFTDEFEVDVNPLPTIAVTPSSASYCTGNPAVALTASGANTYAWSPVTGLSGTTGATVDASPSASTTYTVLGTDGNGCQNSTTVTVTNNGTAPTIDSVTATPNPTILGGNSQLMATASYPAANMANYNFAPSSGTFTPLVGGTVVSSIHADGALSAALPIGFPFAFAGGSYTTARASSDGYLSFGASTTNSLANALNTTDATRRPLVAPLWDDLNGSLGTASYLTTGTAGSQVFTMEWLNWRWNWNSTGAVISFQVKLYEADGRVEFIYRQEAGTVNAGTASIGLAGPTTGNYLSLDGTGTSPNASSTVETTSLNTKPASGQTYTFLPPSVSGYEWSPADFLSSTTVADPMATGVNVAEQTWTVTVTASNGCTSQASVMLTTSEDQVTEVVISGADEYCAGDNTLLTATPDAGVEPFTYSWSLNGGEIGTDATYEATAPGSYTVEVWDAGGGNATSAAFVVTEKPRPVALAEANGHCLGQPLSLDGDSDLPATYAWTGPNSFASTEQSPEVSNSATVAMAGNYTLVATLDGCSGSITIPVTLDPQPLPLSIAPPAVTMCAGSSVEFTASGGGESPESIFGTETNVNSNIGYPAPYSAFYGGQRMQMLVLASELSAMGFPSGASIESLSFPVVSVGASYVNNQSFRVSMGHTAVTSLTAFQGGLTVVAPAGTFTAVAGPNNTHTFTSPFVWNGTDNVIIETTFSNNFFGTVDYATIHNNSTTAFQSTIVYRVDTQDPATVAAGTTVNAQFSARPNFRLMRASDPPTYEWNAHPDLNTTTGPVVIATPTATTTYTVSNEVNGCWLSQDVTVTISSGDTPSVTISADGPTAFCAGGSVVLTAHPVDGCTPFTYEWSDGTNVVGTGATYTATASGNYTVTVTDVGSQTATSAATAVIAHPIPSATAGSNAPCVGQPLELTGGTDLGATFSWSGPNGFTSTEQNPTVSNSAVTGMSGEYVFTTTSALGCPGTPSVVNVTVSPVPGPVTITPPSASTCPGVGVELTASGGLLPGGSGVITGTSPTTSSSTYIPFYRLNENNRVQYIVRASELTALGVPAGAPLNSVSFNVTTNPGSNAMTGYTVKIGHTANTDATSWTTEPLTTVYGPALLTPVLGANTLNFSTEFVWNGTSNIVLDLCFENDPTGTCDAGSPTCWGSTPTMSMATAPFTASRNRTLDNGAACNQSIDGTTSTLRPVMTLGYQGSGDFVWDASPDLNTTTGPTVIATPTATTSYSVSSVRNGCSSDAASVLVTLETQPGAEVNRIQDCENGAFSLQVDIIELGGGTSTGLAWTVNGAPGVGSPRTGLDIGASELIGPFGVDDEITVSLLAEGGGLCGSDLGLFYSGCPIILDCSSVLNETFCYRNNETRTLLYETPISGETLVLDFTQGALGTADGLLIYDGADENAPLLAGGNFGGNLAGQSFISTTNQLFLVPFSNEAGSCEDGTHDDLPWLFSVRCNPDCMNPAAEVTKMVDCGTQSFTVDVMPVDMGDSETIGIRYWVGANPADTIFDAEWFSTNIIGPWPLGTTVGIELLATDPLCNSTLSPVTSAVAECPNNEPCDARPLAMNPNYTCTATTPGSFNGATLTPDITSSCTPGLEDLWFKFTATAPTHRIQVNGSWANKVHSLFVGDCEGGLVQVAGTGCTTGNTVSNPTGLTVNETYYVRVSNPADNNHDITVCVSAPPMIDMSATSLVTPTTTGCLGANETVTVRVTNNAVYPIDLSVNPVTVNTEVTGAATASLSGTANTGTIAPGATLDVPMSATLNMLTNGTYTFNASTAVVGDGAPGNDAMTAANRSQAIAALPQTCDFQGPPAFSGANLTAGHPNWREGAGATAPAGTTSLWANSTLGGSTTARINLYFNNRNEWIVGPKFIPVLGTEVTYDIAISTSSGGVHTTGMQGTDDHVDLRISTDCGATWTTLYAHNAATTTAVSNTLVNQRVDLSGYAGQQVMIAFHAVDGPVDDTPDYYFHLDNINIQNVTVCTGIPTAGTAAISNGAATCAPATAGLSISGHSTDGAVEVKWWSATNPGGPYDTEVGMGAIVNLSNIPVTTYYVASVKCLATGDSVLTDQVIKNVTPTPVATASGSGPLCAGDLLQLTGTSSIAGTYAWSGPNGFASTELSPSVANATTAASGTYTLVATANDCPSIGATTVVTINPVPTAITITPPVASICSGSVELTASGGLVANDVVVGGTSAPTTSAASFTAFFRGDENHRAQYIIRADELAGLGMAANTPLTSLSFTVTTNPGSNTMTAYTVQIGHTANNDASNASGWAPEALTTVYGPTNLTPALGANTLAFGSAFVWNGTSNIVIDVCFTNDPGNSCSSCWGNTPTMSVAETGFTASRGRNIDNTPVCGVTGNETVSTLRPVMTFGYLLAADFTWDASPDLNTTTGAVVTATPTATNTYTAHSTINGCTASQSVTINVGSGEPPVVDVTAGGPSAFCAGGSVVLTADAVGCGPFTYEWSDGTNVVGTDASYTATAAGSYTVAVTDALDQTETSAPFAVTVYPVPSAVPTAANACLGQTLGLNGSTDIGITFAWTGPNGFASTEQNPTIANATTAASGTYTFTATSDAPGNCASAPGTVLVSMSPAPSAVTITPPVASICSGSVELTASGGLLAGNVELSGASPAASTVASSPFFRNFENGHKQYVVRKSELDAIGVPANTPLNSLSFVVTAVTGTNRWMRNFSMKLAHTTNVDASTWVTTGLSEVYGPLEYTATVGTNTLAFHTPFVWNGTDNLVIDICYANDFPTACTEGGSGFCWGNIPSVMMATAPFTPSTVIYYSDTDGAACSVTTTSSSTNLRPVMTFGYLGATEFVWDASAYLNTLEGATVIATPTETSTFVVRAISDNGCEASQSVTVSVGSGEPPSVAISAGGPDAFCAGGSVVLTADVEGCGPFTYEWSDGTNVVGTDASYTATAAGSYTVSVTDVNDEEGVSAPYAVTVYPVPTAVPTAANACLEQEMQLTGTSDIGATFAWSGPNGFASTLQNPTIANATVAASGTYTFTATSAAPANCVSAQGTVVVSVTASPSAVTITPAALTICEGGSAELTASGGLVGGSAVVTGTSPGTSDGNLNGHYRLYENTRTQYIVRASELTALGLAANTAVTSLSFNFTTVPGVALNQHNLNGYTVKIAHTANTDATTWAAEALTTVYGPTTFLPVVGANTLAFSSPFVWNGTSNIVIDICFENDPGAGDQCTGGSGPCWGNTATVSVATAPFTASRVLYDDDEPTCSETLATTGTIATSAVRPVMTFGYLVPANFVWDASPDLNTTTGPTVIATPTATSTYTVNSTVNGCTTSQDVTITIGSGTPPTASINAGGPAAFCAGGSVMLTATVADGCGPFTYEWSDGTNVVGTGVTHAATASGNYTVTVTDASEQTHTSAPFAVTVYPASAVASASAACLGQTLQLTGTTDITGATFAWSGPNGFSSTLQNPTIANVTNAAAGTYTLTVTGGAPGNCVSQPATVAVVVNPAPAAITVTPAAPEVCEGGSVELTASGGVSSVTSTLGTQAAADMYPAPYNTYYAGQRMQMLVHASELSALGYTVGTSIQSIAFPVVATDDYYLNNTSFRIAMGHSSLLDIGEFVEGLTVVAPATTIDVWYSIGGYYTHTFTTPFVWNGVDNVVVETTFANTEYDWDGVTQYQSPTSFQSTVVAVSDDLTPAEMATVTEVDEAFYARPDFRLVVSIPADFVWDASPDLNTTVGAVVTATPGATATYTVRSALNGCESVRNVTVTVHEEPVVSAGSYGTVCGLDASDVALVGTPSGGTFSGTGVSGSIGSQVFDPSVGTQTLTYTVSYGSGCTAVDEVTITVNSTDTDGDGIVDCADNCPNTPGQIGDVCDTGNGPGVVNGSCNCVPTGCTENVVVDLRTDLNSHEASFQILAEGSNTVMCEGGVSPSFPPNVTNPIVIDCCLPQGCYRLVVSDAGGDGFVTGGYQLREQGSNGRRIIDNFGNFTTGSTSAISNAYDGGTFCLPVGDDRLIFSSCDKVDWVPNKFVVATENTAVSAQYGVSNANSGYEYWFFDPNGSYSYRRFRSHATSDGYGTGALRACHFKINGWTNSVATPHIPANRLLNLRIRGRVAGVNLPFGQACLFKIDETLAMCPRVKLQDNPAIPNDFSCGVTRNFGGSSNPNNRLYAAPPQPVPTVASNQVRYQFRFRIPGEGICIVRPPQQSAQIVLNWTNGPALQGSKTYEVDVRVSLNAGSTWCFGPSSSSASAACADTEEWGKVCSVTINANGMVEGGNSMVLEAGHELTLYPNPNRGEQVFLNLTNVAEDVNTVSVDIYDLTGKRVIARSIPVQDGFLHTNVELGSQLAGGLYMVNITAGDKVYTERLVIQP